MPPSSVRSRSRSACAQISASSVTGSPQPGGTSTFIPRRSRSTAARDERRAKSRGIGRGMIARRDPSPPRSGAAGSDRLRLLVASAAAAPARRRLAPRTLPEQPERGGHAPALLPVLRGEPIVERGSRSCAQLTKPTGENVMRRSLTILALLMILAGCATANAAQSDEIRTVVERFVAAQNAHDLAGVSALLWDSPDFLWITRGTAIWGREPSLKRFEALYQGTWRLEPVMAD